MMLSGFKYTIIRMTGPKPVRAEGWLDAAEAGIFQVVPAPWVPKFHNEISRFPLGAHDDQCDALSDAFTELAEVKPRIAGVLQFNV